MKRIILWILLSFTPLTLNAQFTFFDLGSLISGLSIVDGSLVVNGDLDVVGDLTAGTITSDAGIVGTSVFPAVTNVGTIGDITTIWNTGTSGTWTLGDDSDNVNGVLNIIGADGDTYNIGISAADQMRIVGTGVLLFDSDLTVYTQSANRGGIDFVSISGIKIFTGTTLFGQNIALDIVEMAGVDAEIRLGDTGTASEYIAIDSVGTMHTQMIAQETYVIRKHVALSGATDNSATNIFTITTADETGSADGGMYSVKVHLSVGEAVAASGAVNTASMSLVVHWTRIMASAGTGANSAISEISQSASADEGTGLITDILVTVTETSEFVQQVLVTVNTSGGTADAFAMVELIYSDFTTAPVIN